MAHFQIHGHDAIVLTIAGASVVANSLAHVQLNGAPTNPEQRVAIVGESAELGAWDIRRVQPLECVNGNTWFGQIGFNASVGKEIAYKYVILPIDGDAAPQRENCMTRRRRIAEGKVVKWRDVWEE